MNYKDYNDFELLELVKEENEDANNILFNKYMPLINSIAHKYYKNGIGVELNDLIQEGMVGLSFAINSFRNDKDTLFFTYALTCIERKIHSAIRTTNTLKNKFLNESLSFELENEDSKMDYLLKDNKVNPENMLLEFESQEILKSIINNELTDLEKKILNLKLSGLNYKDISNILDISVKSVDNAIQRLRTKIKKSYNKYKNSNNDK